MGSNLRAEPEAEVAVGEFLQLPGNLRRDHRAAREGDGDTGRHLQLGCGKGRSGHRWIGGSTTFGEQHPVETSPPGLERGAPIWLNAIGKVITSTRMTRP